MTEWLVNGSVDVFRAIKVLLKSSDRGQWLWKEKKTQKFLLVYACVCMLCVYLRKYFFCFNKNEVSWEMILFLGELFRTIFSFTLYRNKMT